MSELDYREKTMSRDLQQIIFYFTILFCHEGSIAPQLRARDDCAKRTSMEGALAVKGTIKKARNTRKWQGTICIGMGTIRNEKRNG